MAHAVRIPINFRPATVEETARALRIRPSERRVAEALVRKLLGLPRNARLKTTRKTTSTAAVG